MRIASAKRHHDWFNSLREAVQAEPDSRKRIFAAFGFLETWLAKADFRGCAFLNITSETPALGPQVRALVVDHKAQLRTYIHRLVTLAESGVSEEIGDAAHVLFEGAIAEAQVTRDLWPVRAARAAAMHLIRQ